MNDQLKAAMAIINARVASMNAERVGMEVENQHYLATHGHVAYGEEAFSKLPARFKLMPEDVEEVLKMGIQASTVHVKMEVDTEKVREMLQDLRTELEGGKP